MGQSVSGYELERGIQVEGLGRGVTRSGLGNRLSEMWSGSNARTINVEVTVQVSGSTAVLVLGYS